MNITQDKILVMAKDETIAAVKASAEAFSNLDILTAASENEAFELIYNHTLVLVIIDAALPHIDTSKMGPILLSHKQIYNTPLLILCDTSPADTFLSDFDALQIDYLLRPYTNEQIQAKIKIFFDLFKQKNVVQQSINELDRVYQKVITQHEQSIQKNMAAKSIATRASIAASQIQESLRNLQGNIYPLLKNTEFSIATRSKLASIKTASEKISMVTKKLISFSGTPKTIKSDQDYKILYAQGSDEDFNIFNHFIKGVLKCDLYQAKTIEQSLELISKSRFDLIFIDYAQSTGTGFDLLSELNQMHSDIPVTFTLDKAHVQYGPDAISKGAFSYFIKEELSHAYMLSIINNTLEKASLTKEVEDAQSRIVMISRKDYLTKLYNRRCFEQALESEFSKAKRYGTDLSILLLEFDDFQTITNTHGYDIGDQILTTSATIIQSMVRGDDVVCRYGTEEFGIVLANTAISGARILADRIREKLAEHEFNTETTLLKLTVSIGIAAFDDKSDTIYPELVKKGFKTLASAMKQGGNTVKTYIKQPLENK